MSIMRGRRTPFRVKTGEESAFCGLLPVHIFYVIVRTLPPSAPHKLQKVDHDGKAED